MRQLLIVVLLLPLILGGCFEDYGPMRGWGHMMNYGCGYGGGGIFMWIIFLIAIGLLIYFIFQVQKTKNQKSSENESPLDILKMRYAKGEISKEDFERMKKDLEN
jgi:putative membrane protein